VNTLLEVNNLSVQFAIPDERKLLAPKRILKAVDDVSFQLMAGQTLGIVGESGCGKSTLARGVLQLVKPKAGQVLLNGTELTTLDKKALRQQRRHAQMIFQDPLAALNPRMTLFDCIAEPLTVFEPRLSQSEKKSRVLAIMDRVGLASNLINRFPHEFSGGQCQRIGIARALILKPQLIICDEPVSALDVSIRAQIVNLLMELQREFNLALIFIAHDLHIVRHISHRVMVMYLGKAVEIANSETLYQNPLHPYTQALINAVPVLDPKANRSKTLHLLQGELPSPLNPPSGCAFRNRCPLATAHCSEIRPLLTDRGGNRFLACHEVK
jgi:oligopeptide transport system ATP-binding protein